MNEKKPNILCIMSDEHTWNVLGCCRNPVVKTPNLDRIAKNGIVFENCYTPSPLCVPARLAFTAGQYISRCGAWQNNSELPSDDYPSLYRLLGEQGYECALGGKMHFSHDRRYGFDVDLNPKFNSGRKNEGHVRVDINSEPYKKMENKLSPRFGEFKVSNDSFILNHDRKVTQICGDYIKGRKKDDKPFFVLAGYLAPHFPIIIPEEFDTYRDLIPMPVIPENHIESLPFHYKVMRRAFGMENVPDEIVKKGRELYYGFVTWLDNEIGKLLSALDDSESADNTVIVYTTDHGENMGEHGMWWKNNMYDTSVKIPCIVSFPDKYKSGTRINEVCSLIDLSNTIAEIGGAKAPVSWNGNSLMGLIEGKNDDWSNIAVSEYYGHNIAAGHCMIRRGKYKYVYFNAINDEYPAARQLFDLEADPGEFDDLSSQNAYSALMDELHCLLVKEIGRYPEDCEAEIRKDLRG